MNDSATAELCDAYAVVRGMLLRRAPRVDALDLAHDAVVVALETDARRRALGVDVRRWLVGIARTCARGRRNGRESCDEAAVASVASTDATPEASMHREWARACLRAEVAAALPARSVRLVWARYDLDEDELCHGRADGRAPPGAALKAPNGSTALLAAQFGMSPGAVKGALHYATRKLVGTALRPEDVA